MKTQCRLLERGQGEWIVILVLVTIFLIIIGRGGLDALVIFLILICAIWYAFYKGEKKIKKYRKALKRQ